MSKLRCVDRIQRMGVVGVPGCRNLFGGRTRNVGSYSPEMSGRERTRNVGLLKPVLSGRISALF